MLIFCWFYRYFLYLVKTKLKTVFFLRNDASCGRVVFFVGLCSVLCFWNVILFGLGGQESLDLVEAARDHAREGSSVPEVGWKQGQTLNFAGYMLRHDWGNFVLLSFWVFVFRVV